jgi:hypothetical protein
MSPNPIRAVLLWLRPVALLCVFLQLSLVAPAGALPTDFIGRYEIVDSRSLSISGGAAYVIQDGQLVLEIQRNRERPHCRALQTGFDETSGNIDIRFQDMADGSELAVLKTVPRIRGTRPTTIECYSETGFFGALDLSIALGQIVRVSR